MKISSLLITAALMTGTLHAEFRTWSRNDGKTAQLDLVGTTGEGDDLKGTFRMRNGRSISLAASDFTEADAELVRTWKPEEAASTSSGEPSVFDDILEGNLVALDGKKLKKFELASKPEKYYVFYYTASWCGPCQAFTPSLVEFYEKNKNDKFELVLITSDDDKDAMEDYAAEKKMPWPSLKLSKADDFKKKFDHEVSGIPSVIVCDLDGKIVSRDGRSLAILEKLVK